MGPIWNSERLQFLAHIRYLAADGRGCSPSELVVLLDMVTDANEEVICLRRKLGELNEGWSLRDQESTKPPRS
jgi:hypothetical protein